MGAPQHLLAEVHHCQTKMRPNKGLELTAYSVRSCLAPASSSSSDLALAVRETMTAAIVSSSDGKSRIGSPRFGE